MALDGAAGRGWSPDAEADDRVQGANLYLAIGGAAAPPMVVDLDDEAPREHLLRFAWGMLRLPEQR